MRATGASIGSCRERIMTRHRRVLFVTQRCSPEGPSLFDVFLFLLVSTFALLSTAGKADPTNAPGETAEGVFGEATASHGQADSRTGAMTWTYPFNLPVARGGGQPLLSLDYNSSSHDREAGYGWGLDLPVIERKPLAGNPCFNAEDSKPEVCGSRNGATPSAAAERYAYNGQPLVFICQFSASEGSNNSCGDDQPPKWITSDEWLYFRLQIEGEFSRFYLSSNRRYWRVQLKGGGLLEFGERPNSGLPGIEHVSGNENAVVRWRLVRQSDDLHQVSGAPVNYVDYRWRALGSRGLLYLTDIYDTPRANGSNDDASFAHHTQLFWQQPDFPQTYYADPYRATPDFRLFRVAVASMAWSGIGPREVIRTYRLSYAASQGVASTNPSSKVFQLWHHSFLSEIALEGRCNQVEDNDGNISLNHECASRLPPTSFEYEDGNPDMGIASFPQVEGGPANAVNEYRVLPSVDSVGIVDFNRDGMPDIVQSWDNEKYCPGEGEDEDADAFSITLNPTYNFLQCHYETENAGGETRNFQRSRAITGYLNRGVLGFVHLVYQCMDAGSVTDPAGLTYYNRGRIPGFLTNTGGTTLIGSWSEGSVAWSNAQFAPYRARPWQAGSNAVEFEPGHGCSTELSGGPDSDFSPGWRWEKTHVDIDWARFAENDPDFSIPPNPGTGETHAFSSLPPRWYTDIDGDGLIDRLVTSGVTSNDFETAYVEYTQRYGRNERGSGSSPAQIPFGYRDTSKANSLAPRAQGYSHPPPGHEDEPGLPPPQHPEDQNSYFQTNTKYYYVDINGDGLVDLVTQNVVDDGGVPRVRPGDGHGGFTCIESRQTWPCQHPPNEIVGVYEIEALGFRSPWPFTDDTFFHDVTGDGLADIVQYDMASGEVRLWVNQDGHTFACATPNCLAGKVINANASTHGLDEPAAFDIGDHRITFADMNADGIDDIVILAKQGAYVGTFMQKYVPMTGFERGAAPRPGLLIRIHNGYGATTDIRYQTIQQLDLAAKGTPAAWTYHSPSVENVVTRITTQDSYDAGGDLNDPSTLAPPYQFKRKAEYFYQNPAYDRWARSFIGFRKVVAHYGDQDATTATTYWFGPCQNNLMTPIAKVSSDILLCQEGSDDDDDKSRSGRIVRVDRGNQLLNYFDSPFSRLQRPLEVPRLLWTKTLSYSTNTLLQSPNGERRVAFSYPSQIDTFLYEETQPTKPGETLLTEVQARGGDSIEGPAHQIGVRKHTTRGFDYDVQGTLVRIIDKGAVKDEDSVGDADTVTMTLISSDDASGSLPSGLQLCKSDWRCLPNYISVWQPQSNSADLLLRKSHFTYTASGDVESIQGWLTKAPQPLERHHSRSDRDTAPVPPGQTPGWHTIAAMNYDLWGNVTRTVGGHSVGGSPPTCADVIYDPPYQQLPQSVKQYVSGCAGLVLETRAVFDRGLEQVVVSTPPNGRSSEVHLDPFGRPQQVLLPNPDAPFGSLVPVLAATVSYNDRKPLSSVDIRHIVGPGGASTRSVTVLNGLGEPVVKFDQGDNNDWVVDGWRETNAMGQVKKIGRPFTYVGDPIAAAFQGAALPASMEFFEVAYDSFGRQSSITETGPGFSQSLMQNSYFPLAVEIRDAEQLKAGGPHRKAFRRVEYDGRGRRVKAVERVANPRTDNIVTTITYEPTGEPSSITRTHAGGTYQRTLAFDSLGHLLLNSEPNTGNNWRYAWDDGGRLVGTSDARGCGDNFFYDGLSRLIGEDYSPCLESQVAYTAPNAATGEGLETSYRYDVYEDDQVRAEPNFADDPKLALGNLVAVRDRGAHTRFNYDARDRIRRMSRQIAKPEATVTTSYASRWFTSRRDYDLGDRLTRKTTGAMELILAGGSEERYSYSPRGALFSIDSSYGNLIKSISYNSEGAPNRIIYGDARGTTANFGYDNRHRLSLYQLIAPAIGSSPPIGYFDYRFPAYDAVGNPMEIQDLRIPWTQLPPEASPVERRVMEYDDLYRLTQISSTYQSGNGTAPWGSPFAPEIAARDQHPVPLRTLPTRVEKQSFEYDGAGNITASSDDLAAFYDRSLGSNL